MNRGRAICVHLVNIRPPKKKLGHHIEVALLSGEMKWAPPVRFSPVHCRPTQQQRLEDGKVALPSCDTEWRLTIGIALIDRRPSSQKRLHARANFSRRMRRSVRLSGSAQQVSVVVVIAFPF